MGVGLVIDPSEDTTDELIDASPAHSLQLLWLEFRVQHRRTLIVKKAHTQSVESGC